MSRSGGLVFSLIFQRRGPRPAGVLLLNRWCVRESPPANSALAVPFIAASDTLDRMAGQVVCAGAGFIMMTKTASLMRSGSGTQTEFVWLPRTRALQRLEQFGRL
ncbi:hypothetical protein Cflav_PD4062 [Pedosphaera parvula Ellin514]|uniref:Uncharacterized protein n=1 Tax=Pedosphaera parvula (strain Ellin514) TaxID=320771 RepID=B9XGX2_PEDPL|nr:hypothetical protein Cflav_PD4062 [Pedosphaera parvula Ellin514]